jgi:RimJ/RimL family protein N-acetyltransferase
MGYGKEALDVLKRIAMEDSRIEHIELSTKPDNTHGIKVYARFGFKDTGVMDGDEEVFILVLCKNG